MKNIDQFKQFFTDKFALLLSLVGLLLTIFTVLLLLLQIDTTQSVAAIRYNSSEALSPFIRGNIRSLYVFLLAPIVFFAIHFILAVRLHHKSRLMSLMLLALLIIVLVFGVAITSAIISINR